MKRPRQYREPSAPQPLDYAREYKPLVERFDPDSTKEPERHAARLSTFPPHVFAWLIEEHYCESWPPALTYSGRAYLARHGVLPTPPSSDLTEVA